MCPDGNASVSLADDEALVQEIPELPAQLQAGSRIGLALPFFDDGVAPLIQGLVELVQRNTILQGVERAFVRRTVIGDDPVGQPPLQNPQIPADVAEPEDDLDRGRHDDYWVLRPGSEGQRDALRLLGLVAGPVEVYLDHPVADRDSLAPQPVAGPSQGTNGDGCRGPAWNGGVRGELHHPGGQETFYLVGVTVVHAHDATVGQDRLVEILEERDQVHRLALRVLRIEARHRARAQG